ncbi:MAG: hypothetical protein NC543_09940 [bacterium]|nr:hypothetical protein [bacterium]MCM1374363.1 hypothetical protein [Muribaculum sp.]
MGISIDVQATKPDYSHLFSSIGSAAGNAASSNWLGDYAAIKNGSYGKLMKAYYADAKAGSAVQDSSVAGTSRKSNKSNVLDRILEEKKHPKVSKEAQKANADLTSGLSSLKTSASALQNSKTYTDTANGQSATDKVVSAMKAYVSDYNNVVSAAKNSTLSNKTAYVANMMSSTAANADKLSEIGVTIGMGGKLELDESKLKAADISKVQELFSADNIMSYGSTVSSRLQFAGASSSTNAANGTDTDSTTAASSAAGLKADGRALASDALFDMVKDKDGKESYDIEKILGTVKSFANNYNRMFEVAESSSNSGVLANLSQIREKTAHNANGLKQFGINVDAKGKMTVDADKFEKSDMSQVQKFFKDYGSSIATSASLVDYYMTTQADASNGYTSTGAYNVQGNTRYANTV